jgi:hypothetical protein
VARRSALQHYASLLALGLMGMEVFLVMIGNVDPRKVRMGSSPRFPKSSMPLWV